MNTFQRTAKITDKLAIVRSVTSTLGEHNFASHYLVDRLQANTRLGLSGNAGGDDSPGQPRCSVAGEHRDRPPQSNDGFAGYLGDSAGAFEISGDPSKPDFKVKDLSTPSWLTAKRMSRRKELRQAVDDFARLRETCCRQFAAPQS